MILSQSKFLSMLACALQHPRPSHLTLFLLELPFSKIGQMIHHKIVIQLKPSLIWVPKLNGYGKMCIQHKVIQCYSDGASTPAKYLQKLQQMQASGAKLAIGLEGHFDRPNIPYMRAALDTLAGAKVPIWLIEVDVSQGPNQAQYLEEILREGFSYPVVQGIVIWAPWHPEGNHRMFLTDNNFKNLPTGDVVDKLLAEWKSGRAMGMADSEGFFETELFRGD